MAPRTDEGSETIDVDLSKYVSAKATVKRMTGIGGLSEKNTTSTTWAGQSFASGEAEGSLQIERLSAGVVTVEGAEAVLVFL